MSSTDDIAASLLRIYDVFRDIGYISLEDIVPAPHDEGAINIELWRSIGMNDTAIDFLRKIPWARAGCGDFIKDSEIIDFSNEYSIRQSRNLSSVPATVAGIPSEVDGSLISLTIRGQRGRAFVVDASRGKVPALSLSDKFTDRGSGTIRIWDGVGDLRAVEERNARAVLDEIYHRYFHLEVIPFEFSILVPVTEPMGGIAGSSVGFPSSSPVTCSSNVGKAADNNNNRYETVKDLAQLCGWPDDFSLEAFKAAASAVPSPKKSDSGSSSASSDENQMNGVLGHARNEDQGNVGLGYIIDHEGDENQVNGNLELEGEHGSHRPGSGLSLHDSSE